MQSTGGTKLRKKMMKIKKLNYGLIIGLIFCLVVWVGVAYAAFSYTYNTATPAGSDDPAEADDRMREIKAAVQERENVDHYWPLTGTEVSDADTGEHRKVTLRTGSAPTAVTDKGFVYVKDVSAKAELFYRDEDGNEIQITSGGALNETNINTGGTATLNDSESNAMVKSHAYLAQTAGFVGSFFSGGAQVSIFGYIGSTDDPAGAGTRVQASDLTGAAGGRPNVFFFVPSGQYFEIVAGAGDLRIVWTPLVSGGAAPIDQD